jgi:peroxiredoxin
VGGTYWTLGQRQPAVGTLIFFYRGLTCQLSEACIIELNERSQEFKDVGAEVVAISSDTKANALVFAKRKGIAGLELGYNLPTEMAISWGLYLSETSPPAEQRIYNEPGLFLVRADGTIHAAAIASMPILRPDLDASLAQFVELRHKEPPAYRTKFVPVIISERDELSFRNGRGAPPIWRGVSG